MMMMIDIQGAQNGGHLVPADENISGPITSLVDESLHGSLANITCPPSQPMLTGQSAPAVALSSTNHHAAQYSQFLASVRDFRPLVADLNASIASVASSVSTMGVDVTNHGVRTTTAADEHCIRIHSPISHGHDHSQMPRYQNQGTRILFAINTFRTLKV